MHLCPLRISTSQAIQALTTFDSCYPQESGASITQQLLVQLAEPKHWDLSQTDLTNYKNLKKVYTDWKEIVRRALLASQKIMQAL